MHAILIATAALVGLPILLHLLMKQEPKRLPFPALRLLKIKQKTNQRKLRLRHFLLLALRMLLIALFGLALYQPTLMSDGSFLASRATGRGCADRRYVAEHGLSGRRQFAAGRSPTPGHRTARRSARRLAHRHRRSDRSGTGLGSDESRRPHATRSDERAERRGRAGHDGLGHRLSIAPQCRSGVGAERAAAAARGDLHRPHGGLLGCDT